MIEREKCCGCTACYSICPKDCITMNADSEGFLYPLIDTAKCINCHACERVCPFNNQQGHRQSKTTFLGVQYKDELKRLQSTAGGVFSLIADYILDCGGVVYATGYSDMVVSCKSTCSKENLHELRGSKYVQNCLNDTFRQIKKQLENEITILFVGTPCQVHAIKNYIDSSDDRLITIDLLCLGVSSPKLFAKWITYLENKYESKVINLQFRSKHYGYATPNVRVFFEDKKERDQIYDTRVHSNLFFRKYNVRPSCYECQFREIPRVSDFTIGDFTEIGKISKELDDDKGTTKLWIHSEKGKKILNATQQMMNYVEVDFKSSNIIGGPKKQIRRPEKREEFFGDAEQMDYYSLVSKWEPRNIKGEFASFIRPVINKMPFKSVIFKALRRHKTKRYNKSVREINK